MLIKRKVRMNKSKKQSKISQMAYRYGQKVSRIRINTKLLRTFIADVVLATLSIAWLVEHLQNLDQGLQVVFATFFIGLVLYFKHKA
jgi:hypothetical protein